MSRLNRLVVLAAMVAVAAALGFSYEDKPLAAAGADSAASASAPAAATQPWALVQDVPSEGVLVVVNSKSWASLSVANQFIASRHVPACNVVALDLDLPKAEDAMSVEDFREKILKPVLAAIKDRGLEGQIDCIAYSSDIPTAIGFAADANSKNTGYTSGSLNGMTYLYEDVLTKDAAKYADPNRLKNNKYFRPVKQIDKKDLQGKLMFDTAEPTAFRGTYGWGDEGECDKEGKGRRYYMSMVLGVTSGRGNTVGEAMACLKRSATADGTFPKGTWYYMYDFAIRTEVRMWGVSSAMAKLEAMGQNTMKITAGMKQPYESNICMPVGKEDILGAMIGQQYPRPDASGSKCFAGAIIDNFTSTAGEMTPAGGQAPLSVFIRFGVAGTSGTVTEPFAIQNKFGTPFMFYHYAKGASMAEAYYQSVWGPYQLLIVGDPLCQPFAMIPKVEVGGVKPGETIKGSVKLAAKVNGTISNIKAEMGPVAGYELYIDGKRFAQNKDGNFDLDTTKLSDGYHDVSVVATSAGDLQTRGRALMGVTVNNKNNTPTLTVAARIVQPESPLSFMFGAPGKTIEHVTANGLKLTYVTPEKQTPITRCSACFDGIGPIRLQVTATIDGQRVASFPVDIEVVAPKPVPAIEVKLGADEALIRGAVLTGGDKDPYTVDDTRKRAILDEAGVKAGETFKIEGYVKVPADDMYQIEAYMDGSVKVSADGKEQGAAEGKGWKWFPMSLAKGLHKITIEGKSGQGRECEFRFGGPGTWPVATKNSANVVMLRVGPKPLPAVEVKVGADEALLDGAVLTGGAKSPYFVDDKKKVAILEDADVKAGEAFKIEGYVNIPVDDMYQVDVYTDGSAKVSVDGKDQKVNEGKDWKWCPMSLAAGYHKITIEGKAGPTRKCEFRCGGPGTWPIAAMNPANVPMLHLGPKPPPATVPATRPAK